MIKLDVTNQTTLQVFQNLQADYTTYIAIEAPKVEGEPTPEQVEALKKHTETVKANAAFFKDNLNIALAFIDRPALSAETLETMERLNATLAQDAKKLFATCTEQYNALVDLYKKANEMSPTPKSWLGAVKLPEPKVVVKLDVASGSTEQPAVRKSVEDIYKETTAASKAQRKQTLESTGNIGHLREMLVAQLDIFQHPDYQASIPEEHTALMTEMNAAKKFCDDQRAEIKTTLEATKALSKQLNDAITYIARPPIAAQDLETLKRLNPEYVETVSKAQAACNGYLKHLLRQRVLVESCLKRMEARLPVLEGEESRLVALIKNDGKPLSRLGSATAYYVPYKLDEAHSKTLEAAITPEVSATTTPL